MAFRDDNEAQRARAEHLEGELEAARARIRELEEADKARARAEARVAELERAPKKETPRQRARREKEERKAQQRSEREAARHKSPRAQMRTKGFIAAGVASAVGVVLGAVLSHREVAVSELRMPPAALDRHASPSEGTVAIAEGVHRYPGSSTPRFSARQLGADCEGFVSQTATLGLVSDEVQFVSVGVAEDDAVVVLAGPSGMLCDVAEGSHRAQIATMLMTGPYRVWVGRRHASSRPLRHVLSVTQGSDALPDLSQGNLVIPVIPSE